MGAGGHRGSDNIAQLKDFPDNTQPANPTLIKLALQLRSPTENNDSFMTWGIFYIENPNTSGITKFKALKNPVPTLMVLATSTDQRNQCQHAYEKTHEL